MTLEIPKLVTRRIIRLEPTEFWMQIRDKFDVAY